MLEHERRAVIDDEHLRILSICYMISGAISALFSLFGLLYASMGVAFSSALARMPQPADQPRPPEFIGFFFGVIGLGMFAVMVLLAILKFIAARRLSQRRSRILCLLVAAVTCLGIPFGTVLGVFTFIVLSRPSIVRAFEAAGADGAAGGGGDDVA